MGNEKTLDTLIARVWARKAQCSRAPTDNKVCVCVCVCVSVCVCVCLSTGFVPVMIKPVASWRIHLAD